MPADPPTPSTPPRGRDKRRRTGQGVEFPALGQTPGSEEELREDERGEAR